MTGSNSTRSYYSSSTVYSSKLWQSCASKGNQQSNISLLNQEWRFRPVLVERGGLRRDCINYYFVVICNNSSRCSQFQSYCQQRNTVGTSQNFVLWPKSEGYFLSTNKTRTYRFATHGTVKKYYCSLLATQISALHHYCTDVTSQRRRGLPSGSSRPNQRWWHIPPIDPEGSRPGLR